MLVKLKRIFNIDNLVVTTFILYMASASTISVSDTFYSVVFSFFTLFFIYKRFKVDSYILVFILIWIFINILSYLKNEGLAFSFLTFLGVTMKLILPYLMIKASGPRFLKNLIDYVYILALISFPMYIIDALMGGFFDSLAPYLDVITLEEQKLYNGWYIYIYMHNAWAYVTTVPWLYRNSGFMWEAGGYALILVLVLSLHFSLNRFKWDRKAIVFSIAIISTFSTSGILAFFFIIVAYSNTKGKGNYFLYFLLTPILIYIGFMVWNLDMISGKIETYYLQMDVHNTHYLTGIERVNRFAILQYNLEQSLVWPFGNGILDSIYLYDKYGTIFRGPNTFAGILYKFGIVGFILVPYFIYRFYGLLNRNRVEVFLFSISLFVVLFSNALEIRPLVYILIYYYLSFSKLNRLQITKLYYE